MGGFAGWGRARHFAGNPIQGGVQLGTDFAHPMPIGLTVPSTNQANIPAIAKLVTVQTLHLVDISI